MAVLTLDSELDAPQPDDDAPVHHRPLVPAAACSLGAAAIHFAFAGDHFDVETSHGAAFLVAGALQSAWALALLVRPTRLVRLFGLFNLAIAGLWVASRTVGVDGYDAEPVGLADSAATGLAIGAVVFALARLRLPRALTAFAVIGAGALSIASMTPSFAGEGAHSHGGATGDTHAATEAAAELTPCEKSGPPASPAQVNSTAEGHDHRGPLPQKPVDQPTRLRLAEQQEIARGVVERYPTVAAATARGYKMSTPYIPCIGAHYTNALLAVRFDPAMPAELLFDGTSPDSKLVGLSYLVYHPGGPPEGFAGPNDVWHQHNANGGLCFNRDSVVIAGEASTPEECKALGGRKVPLTDVWMLHDWIVPGWECSWGVFAPECPELGGRIGGTAWDD